ncbi:UNVERIFIED_ORG: TolB-like protein [Rhizobium esperanzae]
MVPEEGQAGQPRQEPENVRLQLDRILASPEFLAPERGRRFLQYIVEETLDGRGEQLKASTIAQAVFGRDASFDAQNDPVVRIEAGRIRRALERYYLVCGHSDLIEITIPKGGYAPHFSSGEDGSNAEIAAAPNGENKQQPGHEQGQPGRERPLRYRDLLLPIGIPALFGAIAVLALIRPLESYLSPSETPPSATSTSKTRIVVEPFAALGGTARGADLAKGLADQLIAKLMNVDSLVVLAPGRSGVETSGSLFNLQGSTLVEGTVLHLHVRLINGADGAVVWANQYDRDLRDQTTLDVEDEIAAEIILEISTSRKLNGADPLP